MMEYSNSQATKQALIDASGELFARNGYAAVTTREIAKSACENIGSIHYHFGGKEGLLDAAIDYAIQPWKRDPFGKYLAANEALLSTKKGQLKFVDGLIELLFETTFTKELPEWGATFVFQTLQRDLPGAETIFANAVRPTMEAFIEIYKRIKGDESRDRAHIWFHSTVSPVFLLSINPNAPRRAFEGNAFPPSYMESMKAYCKASALFGLGLS